MRRVAYTAVFLVFLSTILYAHMSGANASPIGRSHQVVKVDVQLINVVAKIQLSKNDPEPHGLDIDNNGVLWYCDAGRTSSICKLI